MVSSIIYRHQNQARQRQIADSKSTLMNTTYITFLYRFLMVIALCCSGFALSVYASEKTQKQGELKALQAKIESMKLAIDVKENSKSQYTRQLKNIERDVGIISRKIRSSENKIKKKRVEMEKLKQSRAKHQQLLVKENKFLAQQVYAAFTLGQQEKLKLLFSPTNPGMLQRNLVYYQYFSEARVELIDTVEQNIARILETEASINKIQLALENSHKLLQIQKAALDKDKSKRKQILSSIDQQLKKQGGDLSRLEGEASQLQKLISSIQEILIETPEPKLDRRAFAKRKGDLAWPVKGKVAKLFGKQKKPSDLQWQGIMIYAPAGNHVRAVSHGRVAFADWLRGFGYLIIIDHGNSYLSLYGHNESLFKSAGEWVESGDIIGSIGSSGGQQKPGLYFEIRKKGKPQNPTRWCKTGNNFNS
jgi:septal ring factor EnvC (AmiA/AmiB activator)